MTKIIVLADKTISLEKSEVSYCGESKSDIFKVLVPCHMNGLETKSASVSFCFITPCGISEKISLNEIGGIITRLKNYLMFYFRPNSSFYSHIGKVKCWIEIEHNDVLIKSDICEIEIHEHFCNKEQENIIK